MAKKSRTPPPPRRVQSPQRRDEPRGRGRRPLLIAAIAAAVVALGGAALAVTLARGGGGAEDEAVAATLRQAGCTFRSLPSEGRTHVPVTRQVEYDTDPPTSGPHADQWAIWDMYSTAIRQIQGIHNLEHGGILIQYGDDVRQADIDAIAEFYREDPNAILVAPYPRLGNKIALTAWTKLATCTRWDPDAAAAFRDEFRYQGPEDVAPDDLEPGE